MKLDPVKFRDARLLEEQKCLLGIFLSTLLCNVKYKLSSSSPSQNCVKYEQSLMLC